MNALLRPRSDNGEFEASVLKAASRDEDLSVVFLADRVTMQSVHLTLLALDIAEDEDENLDPMYYQELIGPPPPREFRTVPAGRRRDG